MHYELKQALPERQDSGDDPQMSMNFKTIGGVTVALAGSLLAIASQTSAPEATANLASWLAMLEIPEISTQIKSAEIDIILFFSGISIVFVGLSWAIWGIISSKSKHKTGCHINSSAESSSRDRQLIVIPKSPRIKNQQNKQSIDRIGVYIGNPTAGMMKIRLRFGRIFINGNRLRATYGDWPEWLLLPSNTNTEAALDGPSISIRQGDTITYEYQIEYDTRIGLEEIIYENAIYR